MVHLVMPNLLSRLHVDRDQRIPIEIVAGTFAAEAGGIRRGEWNVNVTEFLVGADEAVRTHRAGDTGGAVAPGRARGISFGRHGAEFPKFFAGPRVVRPSDLGIICDLVATI